MYRVLFASANHPCGCFFEKAEEKALYWKTACGYLYERGRLSLNMK